MAQKRITTCEKSLDAAKYAVEIATETDEQTALNYINQPTGDRR